MMPAASARYTAVAIVLHWAMAIALIGNALLGWWMADAIDDAETQLRAITAFQLHKSLGLTVLALSVVRLAWRLLHRPPALPEPMPRWERRASIVTHWAFYVLMLLLPLSGWLYVSTQWRDGAPLNVPTLWFGWFEVPHLFGLGHAPGELREWVSREAIETHELLAWAGAGLLGVHLAAALKHHFADRDQVLVQMLPRWQAGEWARAAVLLVGLAAVAVAAVEMAVLLLRAPPGPAAFALLELPLQPASGPVTGRWTCGPAHGAVVFRGTHAGAGFEGEFTRWSAQLAFDPENLSESSLTAGIATASATDEVPLHDQTLPEQEWFDVAHYPEARFASTRFAESVAGHYAIEGVLTIKDRQIPVALELRLDAQGVAVNGRFKIDRAAANLGLESDPEAEYVSREIEVQVRAAGIPAR